ncbi:hypothetical protein [Natrinema salaciae]|uniref:Cohesin domain-containing protein n=1 Tax=Natrinema salaciae TaxID=1186196 RepID=A0A1H9IGY7_9EURY|nr:hypothetical protein [Natrinema salaciae]SEQ73829.1 hypothetical protein SAMN04489841_2228 [Natrinema salaciae]
MHENTEIERVERADKRTTATDGPMGRRPFLAAVGLVGVGSAAGPVVGETVTPTVTVTAVAAEIDPGETTTVDLGLTAAPDGLSGFNLAVSVDTDVATVVDAELGGPFADAMFNTVEVTDETATLEAAQEVEAGATDVAFGTVELEGAADGETTVEVAEGDSLPIEDGNGEPVEPEIETATLTVGDGDESTDGGTASDDENPGFGPLTAVAGATGGVAYALRRHSDRSGGSPTIENHE